MKTKIICVVGPTASGKTLLSVEMAKQLNAEIISADSMQVYKNMPIATAVATKQEQQGITHHLIEFLQPDHPFSVAEFVELAKQCIDDITQCGKNVIVVGGTGLFVDSLVNDITFSDVGADLKLREQLEKLSNDELYEKLLAVDSTAAENIHKNNRKRVVRALELYYGGTSKTTQNINSTLQESAFDALYIGINFKDRQNLYNRINLRVDNMIKNGIIDEAKRAYSSCGSTARQAIGHKELLPYINGTLSLDEACENLKRETRRYAKRQLTWFRRNEKINWFYPDEMDFDTIVGQAVKISKEFLNN